MSGMFFDNPAVRFSRRFSFYQIRMRYFASLLFRWLTGAEPPLLSKLIPGAMRRSFQRRRRLLTSYC